MNKSGRLLSVLLACVTVLSCASLSVSAEEGKTEETSAAPKGAIWADGNPDVESENQNSLDVIKWFSESDQGNSMDNLGNPSDHYYLLMPTTADLENLTMWHSFSSNPTVNGVEIENGKVSKAIGGTGDYTLIADGNTYTLTVMQSQFIGSVYIETASGNMSYVHADKENKEKGNILVVQADGTVDYSNSLDHIKGRGNTTWTNIEKKPYNIKLSKKASLLGMDESKKWCLLANGQDHTMMRNKIAYDLADETGLDFSPDSQYADLYLNGEYAGVYQLSEKVEEGKNNLVKINDLSGQTEEVNDEKLESYTHCSTGNKRYYEIPNNPEDITGGYLLEWEVQSKYNDEPSGFVTNLGQYVVIKGPEYASKEQVEYISGFVNEMEEAIYSSNGYNSKGKYYTEYIDIQSAALMYLLQEYSVNIDSGITSCFFYKDSDSNGDGKIHASPAWDFDVAFGNLENTKDGVSMKSTDKWFARYAYQYGNGRETIFAALCGHKDFWETVTQIYNSKFKPALDILTNSNNISGDYLKSVVQYRAELEPSAEMNFVRWDIKENRLVKSEGSTYDSQIQYLLKFLSKRAEFLDSSFNGSDNSKHDDSDSDFAVYFSNANNWENVYIYYWNGSREISWPGKPMEYLGDGIYKFDFGAIGESDSGALKIVINNGYGNGKQTIDLSVENHSLYTPNPEPSKTDKDAEAEKFYYDCEVTEYHEAAALSGDVDFDGEVTSNDAIVALRCSVGLEKVESEILKAADMDSDGEITSNDAIEILRLSIAAY